MVKNEKKDLRKKSMFLRRTEAPPTPSDPLHKRAKEEKQRRGILASGSGGVGCRGRLTSVDANFARSRCRRTLAAWLPQNGFKGATEADVDCNRDCAAAAPYWPNEHTNKRQDFSSQCFLAGVRFLLVRRLPILAVKGGLATSVIIR